MRLDTWILDWTFGQWTFGTFGDSDTLDIRTLQRFGPSDILEIRTLWTFGDSGQEYGVRKFARCDGALAKTVLVLLSWAAAGSLRAGRRSRVVLV